MSNQVSFQETVFPVSNKYMRNTSDPIQGSTFSEVSAPGVFVPPTTSFSLPGQAVNDSIVEEPGNVSVSGDTEMTGVADSSDPTQEDDVSMSDSTTALSSGSNNMSENRVSLLERGRQWFFSSFSRTVAL